MVWFSTQILLVTSRVLVAGFAGCADVLRGLHSHSPSSFSPSGGGPWACFMLLLWLRAHVREEGCGRAALAANSAQRC